jgi:membrane-bound inhibitor of C-type lysozyme
MKKILFILSIFPLFACENPDLPMQCGEYEVQIEQITESSIKSILNGDRVELVQTEAASGVRYSGILNDTDVIMWNKGDDWTLFIGDDYIAECK